MRFLPCSGLGLGGLGSHLAQGFGYLGARNLVFVDEDRVEESNLNRLVGAGLADIGAQKVEVAARQIRLLDPLAKIELIGASVVTEMALKALSDCDVLFGSVDHDGPRAYLAQLAASLLVPYLDLGSDIKVRAGRGILDLGGRLHLWLPGRRCLHCDGLLNAEEVTDFHRSEASRQEQIRLGYAEGTVSAPSVVHLNGIVAHHSLLEFHKLISGFSVPYGLSIRGLQVERVRERSARPSERCYVCSTLLGAGVTGNLTDCFRPEEAA